MSNLEYLYTFFNNWEPISRYTKINVNSLRVYRSQDSLPTKYQEPLQQLTDIIAKVEEQLNATFY